MKATTSPAKSKGKAAAIPAAAIAAAFIPGATVPFLGYGKDAKPDEKVFKKNEVLTVKEVSEDGEEVWLVNSKGKEGWALVKSELGTPTPPAEAAESGEGDALTVDTSGEHEAAPAAAPAKKKAKHHKNPSTSKATPAVPAVKAAKEVLRHGVGNAKRTAMTTGRKALKAAAEAKGGAENLTQEDIDKIADAAAAPVIIKHTTAVQALVKEGSKATLKAAAEMVQDLNGRYYRLGGVLHEIRTQDYHTGVKDPDGNYFKSGAEGFGKYIALHLNVDPRMALHYINVYFVTRAAGIKEAALHGLKFTKIMKVLPLISAGVITADNWSEWGENISSVRGREFDELVRTTMVNSNVTRQAPRGATATKTAFKFVFFEDRGKVVRKALELAKSQMPEPAEGEAPVSDSAALDHIVSEWLQAQK